MEHLFSILIPAYKSKYLKECIHSILAQTYSNYEIIIVDDASPEDLKTILNGFVDGRVHYYRNEKNYGAINVVDNWNKCLDYATGDYVICMGDDDMLMPKCLEEYVKLISKYPGLGVYHAWTEIIDENSVFTDITVARPEYETVYSLIWHRWKAARRQFIGDFLFDVKLLRKNGGFYKIPLAWGSDDITVNIAALSGGIANTQTICFCYRVNSQTISKSGNANLKLMGMEQEREWYRKFLDITPSSELDKKYHQCLKQYFQRYFDKKKGGIIANDIAQHTNVRIFKWIKNKKVYNLSYKILIYAFIQAQKIK